MIAEPPMSIQSKFHILALVVLMTTRRQALRCAGDCAYTCRGV